MSGDSNNFRIISNTHKKWAIHYSKTRKQNYYYNYETKESRWNRPPELTDDDILTIDDISRAKDTAENNSKAKLEDLVKQKLKKENNVNPDVLDLVKDLTGEVDDSSGIGSGSNNNEEVFYGPAPVGTDFSIKPPADQIRRLQNKTRRTFLNRTFHDRLYEKFLKNVETGGRRFKRQMEKNLSANNNCNTINNISNNVLDQSRGSLSRSPRRGLSNRPLNRLANGNRHYNNREGIQNQDERIHTSHLPAAQSNTKKGKNRVRRQNKCSKAFSNQRNLQNNSPVFDEISAIVKDMSPLSDSLVSYSSDEDNQSDLSNKRGKFTLESRIAGDANKMVRRSSNEGQQRNLNSSNIFEQSSSIDNDSNDRINSSDAGFHEEAMEWDDVPEIKILKDIGEVRQELATADCENMEITFIDNEHTSNVVVTKSSNTYYIVLDTNILITNLNLVKKLCAVSSADGEEFVIVIPWVVLQELDKLKNRDDGMTAKFCRDAVNYIYECSINKHPRLIYQSAKQHSLRNEHLNCEVPDDAILSCCLQFMALDHNVMFCTNDKNLVSKATANSIEALTAEMMQSKLAKHGTTVFLPNNVDPSSREIVKSNEHMSHLFKTGSGSTNNKRSVSSDSSLPSNDYLKNIDIKDDSSIYNTIMMELQQATNKFLLNILKVKMVKLFGEHWIKRVVIPPPWSISDLYFCIKHHWFAITDSFLPAEVKEVINKIEKRFKNTDVVRFNRCDVSNILEESECICLVLRPYDKKRADKYSEVLLNLKVKFENFQDNEPDPSSQYDVTISIIQNTWRKIVLYCCHVSDLLGLTDVTKEYDFSNSGNERPSESFLKDQLPRVNRFLKDFLRSCRIVVSLEEEQIVPENLDIGRMFQALYGFGETCDPDFSTELLCSYIKENRDEFCQAVSAFDKLQTDLATCTRLMCERKSS